MQPLHDGTVSARPNSLSDLIKFTALAAALAIFADASIAHAMLWENDPYWTYWVTDTLLMATVYSAGTAMIGMGRAQGAILTLVHVTLLTIYYWTLSPIGLPSSPEWLDFKHTWATGLPVHLGVYFLGYLVALWLWRRRNTVVLGHVTRVVVTAMVAAVAVVAPMGLVQTLVTGEFPGLTWFVMQFAVATPFLLAWWRLAGVDGEAAVVGGVALALLLTTYAHYLGPIGLPDWPPRLLSEISPGAESHWLTYREAFLVMLPLTLLLTTAVLFLAARFVRPRPTPAGRATGRHAAVLPALAAAGALLVTGAVVYPLTGADDSRATLASAGAARAVSSGKALPLSASLRARVEDRNVIRTPLPPHDRVDIQAVVRGSDGRTYRLTARRPMVSEPTGRFPTWAASASMSGTTVAAVSAWGAPRPSTRTWACSRSGTCPLTAGQSRSASRSNCSPAPTQERSWSCWWAIQPIQYPASRAGASTWSGATMRVVIRTGASTPATPLAALCC